MKKLIYISGCHHGGTTLLHRLLGAQPGVTSMGSVKNLSRVVAHNTTESCSCGQKLSRCPFWSSVDNALYEGEGRRIESLDVNSADRKRFAVDNRHLFEAVTAATGADFIVDSSRTADRLKKLQEAFGADAVVPIHIYRRPEAQVFSWKRKAKHRRAYLGHVLEYYRLHVSRLRACNSATTMRLISYERLCEAPCETLSTILGAVGQAVAPDLFSTWGSTPTHVLGGNRMLRETESTIRLDDSWKAGLGGWETTVARVACAPIYFYLQRQADHPV